MLEAAGALLTPAELPEQCPLGDEPEQCEEDLEERHTVLLLSFWLDQARPQLGQSGNAPALFL